MRPKAINGAQRLFTELLTLVERDNKKFHDEWLQTAINYKGPMG